MTCRHAPGDPNCSSTPNGYAAQAAARAREEELYSRTPDPDKYEIVDFQRVGPHVVLKVLYPNCARCSYEGHKVLVILNVAEADMLKWRRIDPHFRDPKKGKAVREAPGPAARFPASDEGWADALAYAKSKVRQ